MTWLSAAPMPTAVVMAGRGLGLALVPAVAERHGGAARGDAEPDGQWLASPSRSIGWWGWRASTPVKVALTGGS